MKQLYDALSYRGVGPPPRSTRHLLDHLALPQPSVSTLLRCSGPFVVSRDGYRFNNAGVGITEEDARVLREHYQGFIDNVSLVGIDAVRSSLFSLSFPTPFGSAGLPSAAVDFVINKVTEDVRNKIFDSLVASIPGKYGRCGGMAFSALDFYLAGWQIDPTHVQPGSGDLRDYIWNRLLDSLDLNAADFLEWTMTLHVLPVISSLASAAIGAAIGAVIGGPLGMALGAFLSGKEDVLGVGGADALLDRTRDHWRLLGRRLAGTGAWPIGLVHGSTANPVDQHQILAIGYIDFGNGYGALDIWDNVDLPSTALCRRLDLDMTGDELRVFTRRRNHSDDNADALCDIKGIICERYEPRMPPPSLQRPTIVAASNWAPAGCA